MFMHCLNRSIVCPSAKGMRGRNGRGRLQIILPVHHFQSDAIDAFRIIYQHARDTTHGIHWRTDMAASPCRHIHATGLMMTLHQAAPITWTMTNHVVKRASVHPIYSDQARIASKQLSRMAEECAQRCSGLLHACFVAHSANPCDCIVCALVDHHVWWSVHGSACEHIHSRG